MCDCSYIQIIIIISLIIINLSSAAIKGSLSRYSVARTSKQECLDISPIR